MKNSNKNGWVRLHRGIEDNPLWFSEPFTRAQAWVDLFLNANHKDSLFFVRGVSLEVKRGQIAWSEVTMCKRWQWSKGKVRRFLKYLNTVQQIEQQNMAYLTSLITILNYEKYQTDQQTVKQTDSKRYINKNVKKDNNILALEGHEDMGKFREYDESAHFEERALDVDGNEIETEDTKLDNQRKDVRKDIRFNLKILGEARGLPYNPLTMNVDLSVYEKMLKAGWSHGTIGETYLELVYSDYWKEKKGNEYPTMRTVEMHLRNKTPQ